MRYHENKTLETIQTNKLRANSRKYEQKINFNDFFTLVDKYLIL